MFVAAEDKQVFALALSESVSAPSLQKMSDVADDVSGLAMYISGKDGEDYLFVAFEDAISVYDSRNFTQLGALKFADVEDIEIQGLAMHQPASSEFPSGFISYAIETEEIKGFALSSLHGVLSRLGLQTNVDFDPRKPYSCSKKSPICGKCSHNGYCAKDDSSCSCFAGYIGAICEEISCENDCSGHGKCIGPNKCECEQGWGGLHCSFFLVEPSFETDANGGDGDDPAIWISPVSRGLSRIITTTKSTQGAGLSVFDLQGHLLQNMPAGEPNNVDMIYNFSVGERKVDLAFAACRSDDTLW
jgi:3-phytase